MEEKANAAKYRDLSQQEPLPTYPPAQEPGPGGWVRDGRRIAMVLLASVLMALNLRCLVRPAGLIPGGFSGLTILIQEIGWSFFHIQLPYSGVNALLNAFPILVSFRFIGKKFTIYSCIMILTTGILADALPSYPITDDPLLAAVFGGLVNGLGISLCLLADATSGGTDFIAIFFAERHGVDTWNGIFAANVVVLTVAGLLFGGEKALYSIIFQFTTTQVLNTLYKRYQKQTLLIITAKPEEIYQGIKRLTNHDATLFRGQGCFAKKECQMLYSVVGRDEVRQVLQLVRREDPAAFVNMIRTEGISGRFYKRPND